MANSKQCISGGNEGMDGLLLHLATDPFGGNANKFRDIGLLWFERSGTVQRLQ